MEEEKKPKMVPYSMIWIRQIEYLTKLRTEDQRRAYYRGIDALISTLFKKDREKIKEFMKTLKEDLKGDDKLNAYSTIQEQIVEALEDAGHFKAIDITKGYGLG